MIILKSLCPLGRLGGVVGFWRCQDGSLVLRCRNCDALWLDPARTSAGQEVRAQPFEFLVPGRGGPLAGPASGWATLGEVEAAGWLGYADLDHAESETIRIPTTLECPTDGGFGEITFHRDSDGGLYLQCAECESAWADPQDVGSKRVFAGFPPDELILRRGAESSGQAGRLALRADIEAAGWSNCIDEVRIAERHPPRSRPPSWPPAPAVPSAGTTRQPGSGGARTERWPCVVSAAAGSGSTRPP